MNVLQRAEKAADDIRTTTVTAAVVSAVALLVAVVALVVAVRR